MFAGKAERAACVLGTSPWAPACDGQQTLDEPKHRLIVGLRTLSGNRGLQIGENVQSFQLTVFHPLCFCRNVVQGPHRDSWLRSSSSLFRRQLRVGDGCRSQPSACAFNTIFRIPLQPLSLPAAAHLYSPMGCSQERSCEPKKEQIQT